jgi:Tfp pilus assembly protein PilX
MRSRVFRVAGRRGVQRGATLIIGLIMIVLISLVVASAFTLASTNLKSVGNMQVREESVAAANEAIEQLVSTSFTTALGSQEFKIDINKDGQDDYTVAVATPTCIRAAVMTTMPPSEVEFPIELANAKLWSTDWDIVATVNDGTSGASVQVRQGVRVSNMSEVQKNAACP